MFVEEQADVREQTSSNTQPGIPESSFAAYARDVARHPLLRPEEEQALSRQIVQLELDLWARLLGRPWVAAVVLQLVQRRLGQLPAEALALQALEGASSGSDRGQQRATLRLHHARAARALRDLDGDREALNGALAVVDRLAQQRLPRGVTRRGMAGYQLDLQRRNTRALRARDRFVTANLRLVLSMVQRYRSSQLRLEDLVQEGNIGLMRAVGRFDPERGLRFSTYASWWIRHALNRALANTGDVVRLPVHAHDLNRRTAAAASHLLGVLGREPTTVELSACTGISARRLQRMELDTPRSFLSTDQELVAGEPLRLVDLLADPAPRTQEDQVVIAELYHHAAGMLARLPELEVEILHRRFGLEGEPECTLQQLGEEHSLSRERIRQLQQGALEHVRRAMRLSGVETGLAESA